MEKTIKYKKNANFVEFAIEFCFTKYILFFKMEVMIWQDVQKFSKMIIRLSLFVQNVQLRKI